MLPPPKTSSRPSCTALPEAVVVHVSAPAWAVICGHQPKHSRIFAQLSGVGDAVVAAGRASSNTPQTQLRTTPQQIVTIPSVSLRYWAETETGLSLPRSCCRQNMSSIATLTCRFPCGPTERNLKTQFPDNATFAANSARPNNQSFLLKCLWPSHFEDA
jgi:hypothetical protein